MLAHLFSAAVIGIDATIVHVEIDVSCGLPGITMVGLPDASVRESRDRVRTAIRNSGFPFPDQRVTVNLGPADVPKIGSSFDVPVALGILAATGEIARPSLADTLIAGELSLDGTIHAARGILPIAIAARTAGLSRIMVPAKNAEEARVVSGIHAIPVTSLLEAVDVLSGGIPHAAPVAVARPRPDTAIEEWGDLADVRGQTLAKRAVEIAAAGEHSLLLVGPPGTGKTMIARRLAGLLPPLSDEESLESTSIHSVAGLLPAGTGLMTARPFRAPHHTISGAALVGGGRLPRPGELSLAHNGVLFLDEMPEFDRRALDVLRQPLEEGRIRIARSARSAEFPARVLLVGAMNPCKCGMAGHPLRVCRCSPLQREQYAGRISGPMLDRLDLCVDVAWVSPEVLDDDMPQEGSASIRDRVMRARERQSARATISGARTNAQLKGPALRRVSRPDADGRALLDGAVRRLALSARAHDRVLRVARTIADLANEADVGAAHVAEALQYRLAL